MRDDTLRRPRGRHLKRRLVAFVVDAGLLSILIFVGAVVLSVLLGPALEFTAAGEGGAGEVVYDAWLVWVTTLAGVATCCAYFCVSWLLFRATPGQRVFGLEVRGGDGDACVTLGRALVRWIALGAPLWIASSMVSGWMGVAAAMGSSIWVVCLLVATARSATGLGLHDRLSGTRVVRVRRERVVASREVCHVR
jgi:hypothetical protein